MASIVADESAFRNKIPRRRSFAGPAFRFSLDESEVTKGSCRINTAPVRTDPCCTSFEVLGLGVGLTQAKCRRCDSSLREIEVSPHEEEKTGNLVGQILISIPIAACNPILEEILTL